MGSVEIDKRIAASRSFISVPFIVADYSPGISLRHLCVLCVSAVMFLVKLPLTAEKKRNAEVAQRHSK